MPKLFAKSKKSKGGGELISLLWWFFALAFNLWLFWIVLNPSQKGIFGELVFSNLFNFFGISTYVLPFLMLYGVLALLIKLGKTNKGFFTLLFSISSILAFFSSILEFIKVKTANQSFNGGWIGYATENILSRIFGDVGALIFSFAFLVLGAKIAFGISWFKLFSELFERLKIDYKQWNVARDEFRARVRNLKEQKERKEKVYDVKSIPLQATIPNPQEKSKEINDSPLKKNTTETKEVKINTIKPEKSNKPAPMPEKKKTLNTICSKILICRI